MGHATSAGVVVLPFATYARVPFGDIGLEILRPATRKTAGRQVRRSVPPMGV